MKILLIEDEPSLSAFVKKGLEEQFYEVECAFDGNVGKKNATTKNYDLIILDINLPGANGFEISKCVRENNIKTPILMLTAFGTTDDKLQGFEAGTDDYLVKPFEFRELLARIKALHNRNNNANMVKTTLKIADLELKLEEKIAIRAGKKIDLTAKEFALLEFFIRNKGKVVSRMDISDKVWDIHFDTGTNVVDVYVNFLRKKVDKDFEKKLINTVVGMGYIMKD